ARARGNILDNDARGVEDRHRQLIVQDLESDLRIVPRQNRYARLAAPRRLPRAAAEGDAPHLAHASDADQNRVEIGQVDRASERPASAISAAGPRIEEIPQYAADARAHRLHQLVELGTNHDVGHDQRPPKIADYVARAEQPPRREI